MTCSDDKCHRTKRERRRHRDTGPGRGLDLPRCLLLMTGHRPSSRQTHKSLAPRHPRHRTPRRCQVPSGWVQTCRIAAEAPLATLMPLDASTELPAVPSKERLSSPAATEAALAAMVAAACLSARVSASARVAPRMHQAAAAAAVVLAVGQ